jgi:glycosyltransferase involved in cell wall biosynthesis
MKIFIFSCYYPLIKGGAEYQSKLLALEMKDDHSVFFISVGHDNEEIIYDDNIKIYCLKRTTLTEGLLLYYPFSKKMGAILSEEKPDIIYQRVLNSFSYHLSNFSVKNHIPFFLHIADNYCLSFNRSARSIVRRAMFSSIIANKTNFITQTKLQNALLARFGVTPILQIHNLHKLPDEIENRASREKNTIIWIGSARKIKQLELFIKLANLFSNNDNLEFVIIGRIDNTSYGESLKSEINLTSNLTYLGEQTNDFVNSYLTNAFLLVNTSVSEGFSNTFIQAWMRGVPVISLNSDPDDIIREYDLGRICDGDLIHLKNSLDEFFNNHFMYLETSQRCLSLSREMFSIEANGYKLKNALGIGKEVNQ